MSRAELAAEAARRKEHEWVRQSNIANVGLLVAALYMVTPFLTAGSLDVSAKISVVAFAVAIPLLAAHLLVGQQEAFRRRSTESVLVKVTKPVALTSVFVGIVAGFWHIAWFAGVAILVTAIVAMGVHSAGFWRLEQQAGGAGKP